MKREGFGNESSGGGGWEDGTRGERFGQSRLVGRVLAGERDFGVAIVGRERFGWETLRDMTGAGGEGVFFLGALMKQKKGIHCVSTIVYYI